MNTSYWNSHGMCLKCRRFKDGLRDAKKLLMFAVDFFVFTRLVDTAKRVGQTLDK